MKKTLFVAVVTAMLLVAFSTSAMAAVSTAVNHSGQMRYGASADATANVPGTGTVNGAGTNTYLDWDPNLGDNPGNGNSPHGNYTTTTVKCVVCHAIHYAGAGGATVGSDGQAADTLLRMRAVDACIFCHATDGMAVNGRPVYNGIGGPSTGKSGTIIGEGNTGCATDNGHITGENCSYCHTNVHASGADDSVASLQGYLLKEMDVTNGHGGSSSSSMFTAMQAIEASATDQGFPAGAALNGEPSDYQTDNSSTMREQAVGVFCAECHLGAYATAAAGASTNVYGAGTNAYSGHRIAASDTTTWNVDGTKSSVSTTGTIAWLPANNCKSCHDALDDYGNAAFPHSWGGTKMWLTAAEYAGATVETLPYGDDANSGYEAGRPQLSDGVCLKCHRGAGNVGVGLTY